MLNGIRQRLKDTRNIIMLLMSLGFVIGGCTVFYVLSLLEELVGTRQAAGFYDFVRYFLRVDVSGVAKLGDFRDVLWRSVFLLLVKVQLFYLLILVARLGPGLIADDLKSNALPIYFARPITPLTYLAGKWLTIGTFIAIGMLIPNLLALLGGILITGGLQPAGQSLALACDLVIAGLGMMVLGGVLILAISSLTADKRYVVVGWLAVVLLPHVAQGIIHDQMSAEATMGLLGSISLGSNAIVLSEWLFDLRSAWAATPLPAEAYQAALSRPVEPVYPALVLLFVTLGAGLVCYRRVVRFSQAAANV